MDSLLFRVRVRQDPACTKQDARSLYLQVQGRDYNPPKPQRIREWQAQQQFPIRPSDDPDACNVYKDLKFPEGVYEHIQDYYEQKVASHGEDR